MRHIRASRDKKSAVRNGLGFYTDSEGGGGFLSPGGGADKISKYTTPGIPKPSAAYAAYKQAQAGDVKGAGKTWLSGGRAISEEQATQKEASSRSSGPISREIQKAAERRAKTGRQTRGIDPRADLWKAQFTTRMKGMSGGGGQELAGASKAKIPLWAWAVGGIAGILLFRKSFKIGKRVAAKLKK